MTYEPTGDFATGWSWATPPMTGTVSVISLTEMKLTGIIEMTEWRNQKRYWFSATEVIFESLEDAVAFRLRFNTGPIRETLVEAAASTQ